MPYPDEAIPTPSLMNQADRVMSYWQVSQALGRMARRCKKRHIKEAFLLSEQLLLEEFYQIMKKDTMNQEPVVTAELYAILPEIRPAKGSNIKIDTRVLDVLRNFPISMASLKSRAGNLEFRLKCPVCSQLTRLSDLHVCPISQTGCEVILCHCIPSHTSTKSIKELLDVYILSSICARWNQAESLEGAVMNERVSENKIIVQTLIDRGTVKIPTEKELQAEREIVELAKELS